MDFLRSIPQAFFDFIARILPGAVAIVLVETILPGSWKHALTTLSAGLLTADNVVFFVSLLAVSSSYALGQLISPIGKIVDKAAQFVARRVRAAIKVSSEWPLPTQDDWQSYDWLRVNAPVPGSFAVKIRAEYTMYNSLAAVFLLAAAWSVFTSLSVISRIGLLTLGGTMAWRGWDVQKTFRLSVQKLHKAVIGRGTPPAVPADAA